MTTGLDAVRVLVVDDNQHMRSIIGVMLNSFGIKMVREAKDGADALETLRRWPADLAICDFLMEPVDGVAFTRQVRNAADSPNPYLPVVMLTGHSELARVTEARDAGVTEFVVKPLTAKALVDRINMVIFKPRPFIRSKDYFGPDRRRKDDPFYAGPFRREDDRRR
ncbi:MAG: response regulator [Pseudomonadota bacterium]|nr:response regulator [Pseudomonadota bacterium]